MLKAFAMMHVRPNRMSTFQDEKGAAQRERDTQDLDYLKESCFNIDTLSSHMQSTYIPSLYFYMNPEPNT
jgi:uncharacterized membrane protein (DUF106 family)